MKQKVRKLFLLIWLVQLSFLSSLQAMGDISRDYFSDDYLPVELQKHILKLAMQGVFQDNAKFADNMERASELLKNVLPVKKGFRLFKNDLVKSFLELASESLRTKYSNLKQAEKNEELKQALIGEKNEENLSKGVQAVISGADPNLCIDFLVDFEAPRPALGWAILWPSRELTTLLLIKGANIDFQNVNGYTALMQAVSKNYVDIVKILLDHKANTMLENDDKETALTIAENKGYKSIAEMLSKNN